jgi:DNA-binding CsgD family transcriptional regulator
MHAEPLIALAERLRDRQMLENALMIRAAIAQLAGDWRSARACIDRILAAVPGSAFTLGFRAMLEYQLGELSQGQVYLDRLLGAMNLAPPGPSHWYTMPAIVIPVVARITGDINHFDTAQAAAGTVLSSLSAVPAWAITARTGLAIIAAQTSNTQTAAEQYAALESVRDTVLLFGHVSADRILGLLAHTMGRLDTAMTHFEDALAFCHKAGYRPELAWTCCDYADTLLQRNVSGDRPRAKALLEGALAISQELGMRPLAERVLARLDLVEAGPGGVPAYPDGLTKREVEVLRLIALGKTNRQLAEGLFISINTVERHVSNILAKTGAVNRTDATGYALRNNMLS